MPSTQEALAEYLASKAHWRARKADEYPEDARNKRSAEALAALETHVRGLPDDDEQILALGANWGVVDGTVGIFAPSEEADRFIGRLGFDGPVEDPAEVLGALIVLQREAQEHEAWAEAEAGEGE
jgi:hypothetical protein